MGTEEEKNKNAKKTIRWYSYVSEKLNQRLNDLLDDLHITNRAKFIRNAVTHYLDYVEQIYQKEVVEKEYDDKYIHERISQAIELCILHPISYEQIKQRLSPLKTSILMIEEISENPQNFKKSLENTKEAFEELEIFMERYFVDSKPVRFIRTFDILHVDDNELERKTIRTFFNTKGFDIKSVETAEEALEALKISTPKVILLDLDLKTSQINGDKLCKIIKSNKNFKHIPVIIMTAMIGRENRRNLEHELGCEEIILKPINKLADLNILLKYLEEKNIS